MLLVILPGGWGTLDELCEALTWAQLGIHQKPCVLWNVEGYYDSFLTFLNGAVKEGFLKAQDHGRLLVSEQVADVFQAIYDFVPKQDPLPIKVLD